MSEGRDTEIQRDRERKNKCKPLRINCLISLWGRMEKKRISTSYPLSSPLISLSLFLSHILIYLVSIHHVGKDSLSSLKHEHTWLT